jgi:hypothetical protein
MNTQSKQTGSGVEGNVLIATFMGIAVYNNEDELRAVPIGKLTRWIYPHQISYHSSWDELIPVWRKVNLSIKDVIAKAKDKQPGLYHTSLDAKLSFACDTFNNAVFQNNPASAQRIIAGLIEWLNDNTTEQN